MIGIHDSTTNHFGSLIRSGGKYIIPKYQRDYSWDVEQWDDLWQDIETMIAEHSEHYMGYLVLQTTKNKDCLIIDGQQRFSTITIIILAAIKAIKKMIENGVEVEENEKRVKTLLDTYIGNIDPVSLEYDNILVLNRNNAAYYNDYIVKLGELRVRNTSHTEKLMKKCFEWYEHHLQNKYYTGREYAEFITYVVDNLYFTIIRVDDEMNAFRVFETLNARGVQLSSADLLKNYLFSLVDDNSQHYGRIAALEEKWSRLTQNIQAEKLPDFIRYYWNSKHKTVRSSELFKAMRSKIKTAEDVFAITIEMLDYSDIYMALRNPNDDLWQGRKDIADNIELLVLFNMRQPYSLLMAAYKRMDINGFAKLLSDIIVVGFRYNIICGKNPNDIEKIYNSIALQLSDRDGYRRELLKNIYVADNEFVTVFASKVFQPTTRNNRIVKYILGKYERHKEGARDVLLDSETDTLEHILPQNPGIEWGDDSYNFDAFIYRIGNICLLEKRYNIDLGNKTFDEKCKAYSCSAFETTRSIPDDYSHWNDSTIDQRQRDMAKCAQSIWKIDF